MTPRPVSYTHLAVGGRSFLAQVFKDAGADYFLKDDERSGGVTLDFETVYSQAAGSDYWRIVNSYQGKDVYKRQLPYRSELCKYSSSMDACIVKNLSLIHI